jgi:hypothetical protein
MITQAEVRRIALSMPEAEEKSHFGRPDFRLKKFTARDDKGRDSVSELTANRQPLLY